MEKMESSVFVKKKPEIKKLVKKLGNYTLYHPPLAKGDTATEIVWAANEKKETLVAKCYVFKESDPKHADKVSSYCQLMGIKNMRSSTGTHEYYITEYANAGCLEQYLSDGKIFSKAVLDAFILQVSKQLATLHKKNMYHGELTPSNILVHLDGSGKPTFRICGFGHLLAKDPKVYTEGKYKMYIPNRDFKVETLETAQLRVRTDIWSLGVILCKMATGAFPHNGDKVIDESTFMTLEKSNSSLANLLKRCLKENESDRIQAEDIAYHPYFIPIRKSLEPYILSEKCLGSGAFASVYLCHRKDDLSKEYAIKIIKPLDGMGEKYQMLVLNEITVLIKLRSCPYAINLIDYFQLDGSLHLVLEFCNGGDVESYLHNLLKGETKPIDLKDDLRLITYNLAAAIKCMHDLNIIHRDIKPKNLLVIKDPATNKILDVKLADFGTAREALQPAETYVGTMGYLAPEIIEQDIYDHRVDVWSFGITLYSLTFGITPNKANPTVSIYKTKKIVYPDKNIIKISQPYVNLMKRCLEFSKEKRINIDKVLMDPFFRQVSIPEKPAKEYMKKEKITDMRKLTLVEKVDKARFYLRVKENEKAESPGRMELEEEIATVTKLNSLSSIVKLYDYFTLEGKVNLIIDYWDSGNLSSFMKKMASSEGGLPKDMAKVIGLDIIKSLSAIVARGVNLKDFSPSSIFVHSHPKPAGYKILIGGICKFVYEGYQEPFYPPQLSNPGEGDMEYTYVMKFGVIMYWLTYGKFNFEPVHTEKLEAVLKYEPRTGYSKVEFLFLKDLIGKCLQSEGRCTFADILKHSFFL